jgi:long-chain acyl-CoA synthetase
MLYDYWRRIARDYAGEIALRDIAGGREWTFAQLAEQAETTVNPASRISFPTGIDVDFIIAVLRGWRAGQVACPLETGQAPPAALLAPDAVLPAGVVHLKTTSASTGASRIVALTAEQLKADADNIVATMGLRREWPNLGVISLAHSYGFSNLVTPLLLHGIPLILVGAPLPESVRAAAARERAITLAAVPALWRVWHEAGAIPPNTRLAVSAGAPLPLPLEQAVFTATGLKLHNFLGASECGGIAYDYSSTPRTDAACVGSAMQGVQLSAGAGGCLEVRSQAVAQSYWPESDSVLKAGCFQTSDLVEIKAGLVFLRGRASDQINVAGRKVSPEVIERALLAHPGIRECLVFGAPSSDAERTEIIVACVAAKNGIESESLRQFLLGALPAWQLPRDWWFLDTLEANQRGKLPRAEWRKKYLARPAVG